MIKIAYLDEEAGWQSTFYEAFSSKYEVNIPEKLPRNVSDVWNLLDDAQAVIVDYRLNGDGVVAYTGDDVAKVVHSHNKHLPIFIITSYEDNAIQSCREVLIIRGKDMLTNSNSQVKLCHMIDAAVNNYNNKKTECEETIARINYNLASGVELSPRDEADRFEAELYLSELNLDSSVRADLIATGNSRILKDMLDTVRSISTKHK